MNQRQIEAFRQVMLRGSMTAAAAQMNTSQPSISRLITELEAHTGFTLFLRGGGRVRATEAGQAFYREVDRSFVGLEKLSRSAQEIRQLGSGRLRLVASPVMALSFVPAVIERFLARYPRIAISLEMRSEPTIQRWASSAYCDIGFATTTPDAFGVVSEALYALAGVCAIPAHHPLAKHKAITPKRLRGQSLILPSYADDTRSAIDRVLQHAGVDAVPVIETPYGATICAMVSRGLGIGIVNPLATFGVVSDKMVSRKFTETILFRGFTIRPDLPQANGLAQTFLDIAHEMMAAESERLAAIAS